MLRIKHGQKDSKDFFEGIKEPDNLNRKNGGNRGMKRVSKRVIRILSAIMTVLLLISS